MALSAPLTIAGNLTADPEVRTTAQGKSVATFTIAMTPSVFNQSTKKFDDGETLFLRCSAWDEMADHIYQSLRKGDRVIAHGQVKSRTFETREGDKRTVIELTVDEIGTSLKFANARPEKGKRGASQNSEKDSDGWAVVDDDTPF